MRGIKFPQAEPLLVLKQKVSNSGKSAGQLNLNADTSLNVKIYASCFNQEPKESFWYDLDFPCSILIHLTN